MSPPAILWTLVGRSWSTNLGTWTWTGVWPLLTLPVQGLVLPSPHNLPPPRASTVDRDLQPGLPQRRQWHHQARHAGARGLESSKAPPPTTSGPHPALPCRMTLEGHWSARWTGPGRRLAWSAGPAWDLQPHSYVNWT